MRGSLVARVLARRRAARIFPRPRVASFQPREVTPEDVARLGDMAARGQWDRDAGKRANAAESIGLLIEYTRSLFQRNHAQGHPGGPMPEPCTWGAR